MKPCFGSQPCRDPNEMTFCQYCIWGQNAWHRCVTAMLASSHGQPHGAHSDQSKQLLALQSSMWSLPEAASMIDPTRVAAGGADGLPRRLRAMCGRYGSSATGTSCLPCTLILPPGDPYTHESLHISRFWASENVSLHRWSCQGEASAARTDPILQSLRM